jgi:hypothetical protein
MTAKTSTRKGCAIAFLFFVHTDVYVRVYSHTDVHTHLCTPVTDVTGTFLQLKLVFFQKIREKPKGIP